MKKCLFPLDEYVVSCPTRSKNLERTLVHVHPHFHEICISYFRLGNNFKVMKTEVHKNNNISLENISTHSSPS